MATLSAYELEREKTIAANNAVLKSLGLDKPILVSKHPKESLPQKRRQSDDDPDYAVPKRTTRVSNRTAAKDSNGSDDDDSEHEDDDYEDIPRPVKASRKRTTPAAPAAATVKLDVEPSGAEGSCIVVEAAKTGRSKCRKCLSPAGVRHRDSDFGAQAAGLLLALCHWRACQQQALRDPRSILWVSGEGQCRDETQ